jgi:hypothetical protein
MVVEGRFDDMVAVIGSLIAATHRTTGADFLGVPVL